eukprot:6172004-Pleurochrysis_carterae.AAC.3
MGRKQRIEIDLLQENAWCIVAYPWRAVLFLLLPSAYRKGRGHAARRSAAAPHSARIIGVRSAS